MLSYCEVSVSIVFMRFFFFLKSLCSKNSTPTLRKASFCYVWTSCEAGLFTKCELTKQGQGKKLPVMDYSKAWNSLPNTEY